MTYFIAAREKLKATMDLLHLFPQHVQYITLQYITAQAAPLCTPCIASLIWSNKESGLQRDSIPIHFQWKGRNDSLNEPVLAMLALKII